MTSITAVYKSNIVEVLDVCECGGVKLAAVRALDGKPFTGGDKWPIFTEFATVKASELAGIDDCNCSPDWVTACEACRLAVAVSLGGVS